MNRDSLADFLGDTTEEAIHADAPVPEEPPTQPRRLVRLALLALVPWLAVGLLWWLLSGDGGGADPVEAPDGLGHQDPRDNTGATGSQAAGEPGWDAPRSVDPQTGNTASNTRPAASPGGPVASPDAALPPAVAAAAALAVRQAGTHGPDADGAAAYVDLAVAEDAEAAGDTTIVRVLALVLEGDGEKWHTARTARYAVPVRTEEGVARAVDRPWLVGSVPAEPTLAASEWMGLDDPPPGIADALAQAGFADVDDIEAHQRTDMPGILRATFSAMAPGSEAAASHAVWLDVAGEPRLLGRR